MPEKPGMNPERTAAGLVRANILHLWATAVQVAGRGRDHPRRALFQGHSVTSPTHNASHTTSGWASRRGTW